LYNASDPCGDLAHEVSVARRRLQTGGVSDGASSHANGGAAIYSLDDVGRQRKIREGWPWDGTGGSSSSLVLIVAVCGGVLLLLLGAGALVVLRKRRSSGGQVKLAEMTVVNKPIGSAL
jgi:LPXTG-motif cell wall-anchored protein